MNAMKNKLIYVLFIGILLFPLFGYSQTFRGLSVSDGLSDLVVNALYKDSIGYVWVGTSSTLERFDGVRFKHYAIPGTNAKMKEVNVITGMQGNEVWMGNNAGLWRVNGDELERISPDIIKNRVYSLLYDGKGRMYVGTEVGLFIYEKGNIEQVLVDPNVLSAANTIRGLALDNKGNLWMATHRGLYSMVLDNRGITAHNSDEALINSYNDICLVDSVLYLGTAENGIVAFDIGSYRFRPYMNLGCITSLSSNGDGILYAGTNGNGVYFISTAKARVIKRIYHEPNASGGLRSNSVYSLLVDNEGIIWVGLFQLGLDYSLFQNELFSTYKYLQEFDSQNLAIRTIEICTNERLIGTRDGLFYVDEARKIYKGFSTPELRSNMVMCSCSFQGKYYIGTYGGGMYVLDPVTVTLSDFDRDEPALFVHGQIFAIAADHWGDLWIGTSEGVFCYKDGKQIRHYDSANSRLPDNNVYGIYFDSTHRGWICTENGVCMLDTSSDRLITDKFPENFVNRKLIREIYEDAEHNLYFLPDKGELFVSDLSLKKFFSLSNTPLDGKNLMFALEDKEGWLWIGTNDGLYRYDKKNTFASYTFADGIPSQIFFNCVPKKGKDDVIWIGNSKGLIYTDVGRINNGKEYPYPIRITDVDADNDQDEKTTIYFSGFTYTDPAYMLYEYKLEGMDGSWQMLKGESEVTYYNLSSGKYIFKVRRAGDVNSEVSLSIRIPSVIWKSWWCISLAVMLVFLCIYRLYKWRMRNNSLNTVHFLLSPEEEAVKEKKNLEDSIPVDKYRSSNITAEDCKRLTERLKNLIRDKKLYSNPELKIADLAKELDVPAYILSYLFNQYLNRNYYDYINDYRIAEFKYLVNKGEHMTYTLNALIEKCGFNSRASFFRHFKRATGMTPNEYIKGLRKSN